MCFIIVCSVPGYVNASHYTEGTITKIETQITQDGTVIEKYTVTTEDGKQKKQVQISSPVGPGTGGMYRTGMGVILEEITGSNNKQTYVISSLIRRNSLFILFGIFLITVLAVARLRGVLSLLSLALSFGVIFIVILPLILKGYNPVFVAIGGSVIYVPISFLLSHGFHKKTYTAIIGTLIALVITGILAAYFVPFASLTGFSSDEAGFVKVMVNATISIQALLIAGIIIGATGILDDTTIAQSGIIFSLKKHAPQLSFKQLFTQGMTLGKDHVASLVNTIVLVYAGAALPLLLLFSASRLPSIQVINYEIIAEEIVRILVSSIGLILAVPITTFLASLVATRFGGE